MKQKRLIWAIAAIVSMAALAACGNDDNASQSDNISAIADKVWTFSQSHPDGFTLDIRTMTEPTEGIVVSYAATQDSHSRSQLDAVVSHALQHDGYVGGWYNSEDGLYYFDSNRLFPETDVDEAIQFGKDNGQQAIFVLSTGIGIPIEDDSQKGQLLEVYNYGIATDFNKECVYPKGSAIFIHCKGAKVWTGGCIAFDEDKMIEILRRCDASLAITVSE